MKKLTLTRREVAELLGISTATITQLNEWKTYRVNVNRVDTSLATDIVWPTPGA